MNHAQHKVTPVLMFAGQAELARLQEALEAQGLSLG
jgi:hypothetical protein